LVHVFAIAKTLQGLKGKEKEAEDRFIKDVNEMVRKDMIKQKAKIETKIAKKQRLTDFEEWLTSQPEYLEL
jgi:hypothetical protein